MDVKTYLSLGIWLDQRINFNLRRLQEMKTGICSLHSPQISMSRIQKSKNGDAPYVESILRVEELQERINRETDILIDIRQQIDETIRTVEYEKYQMLLLYRYIDGLTWEDIGNKLHAGRSTVKRWHNDALKLVRMPDEPMVLRGKF